MQSRPVIRMQFFSYNVNDVPAAERNRLAHAWVNSFSRDELERIFTRNGYKIDLFCKLDLRQMLWKLSRS